MKYMNVIGFVIFSFFGLYSTLFSSQGNTGDNNNYFLSAMKISPTNDNMIDIELSDKGNGTLLNIDLKKSKVGYLLWGYQLQRKNNEDSVKVPVKTEEGKDLVFWMNHEEYTQLYKLNNFIKHIRPVPVANQEDPITRAINKEKIAIAEIDRFADEFSTCDSTGNKCFSLTKAVEINTLFPDYNLIKVKLIYNSDEKDRCSLVFTSDFLKDKEFSRTISLSSRNELDIFTKINSNKKIALTLRNNFRVICFNIHEIERIKKNKANVQRCRKDIMFFLTNFINMEKDDNGKISTDSIEIIDIDENPDKIHVLLVYSEELNSPCKLFFSDHLGRGIAYGEVILNEEQQKVFLEKINLSTSFGLKLTKNSETIAFNIDAVDEAKKFDCMKQRSAENIAYFLDSFLVGQRGRERKISTDSNGKISTDSIEIIDIDENPDKIHVLLVYSEELNSPCKLFFSDHLGRGIAYGEVVLNEEQQKVFLEKINLSTSFGLKLTKNSETIAFNIDAVDEAKKFDCMKQRSAENIAYFLESFLVGQRGREREISTDSIEIIDMGENPDEIVVKLVSDKNLNEPWKLLFTEGFGRHTPEGKIALSDDQKKDILEKIKEGESFGLKLTKDSQIIVFNIDIEKRSAKNISYFLNNFVCSERRRENKISADSIEIIDTGNNPDEIKVKLIASEDLNELWEIAFIQGFHRYDPGGEILLSDDQKKDILKKIKAGEKFGLKLTQGLQVIAFNIDTTEDVVVSKEEAKKYLEKIINFLSKNQDRSFAISIDNIQIIDNIKNPSAMRVTLICSGQRWFLSFDKLLSAGISKKMIYLNDEQKEALLKKVHQNKEFGLKLIKNGEAIELNIDTTSIEVVKEEAWSWGQWCKNPFVKNGALFVSICLAIAVMMYKYNSHQGKLIL